MALNLPNLPRDVRIVDANGHPTVQFQRWWQAFAKAIEAQFGAIDAAIAAQAAADAAQAAAALAASAADSAQDTADAITAESNLVNSYVTGTPPILTATDAGANVTITVAAHGRVYGDGVEVALSGANLTGLAYSTQYFVYYVDPTRSDTTPTYIATTDATAASQTGDTHLVGSVTTPAAGGTALTGFYTAPPWYGNLYDYL